MAKPALPVVLGSGPLADSMRRMMAEDPDRYRPVTISMNYAFKCPCCKRKVYRVTSRWTNWEEGFSTGTEESDLIHPRLNDQRRPDPNGEHAGCCCKAPNWGPLHAQEEAEAKRKPRRKAKA